MAKTASVKPAGQPRWRAMADPPPADLPFQFWGDKLDPDLDFPLTGRVCGCHGHVLLELWEAEDDDENPSAGLEHTHRMLGTPTHWLDWRPAPPKP